MRRLIAAIPILIASSFITFWMATVSADPVQAKFAGRNPPPPRETILAEQHRMRMDEGFFKQYWDWVYGLVRHGDFGPSIQARSFDIAHEVGRAATVTARLVILPYESHGYVARESLLHLLAEEFTWLERWLGAV